MEQDTGSHGPMSLLYSVLSFLKQGLIKKNQLIGMQNGLIELREKFNNNFPKCLLLFAAIETAKLEIIFCNYVL